MPTTEKVDQAALDYGILLANTQKVRQEKADLETETQALMDKRKMLNDENAKTQDATSRVRATLIELEKQVEAVKKMKLEEIENEKRLVEDQRQKLSKGTEDLKKVEEALNRRTIEVESRERNLKEAQREQETRVRQLNQESVRVEALEREVKTMRDIALDRARELAKKEDEVGTRLRKAEDAEKSVKSIQAQNRNDMEKAADDRRLAELKMNELSIAEERMTALRNETKLFIDVAKEAMTFIQQNVRNHDAIDAYFRDRFPALVNRLNNV